MTEPRWFSDLVTHDPRPLEDDPAAGHDQDPAAGRRPVHASSAAGAGLSRRDRTVLASVGTYRYLTTRQIQRLHFSDPERTPLAATRAAHRAVARLHDRGLIGRLKRRIGGRHAGSAAFIWRLRPAGARVVGIDTGPGRSREPGIGHLAHTLDVAEVVVRLHERARSRPIEVTAVETEPDCWRRYVTGPGRKTWLKPDLRLTLRVPGHELHWFIEVDRGSEYRPTLQRKVGLYVGAWRDGGEAARAGVFPRVAWIVPTQPRANDIASLCAATPGVPAGLFVVTVRAVAIDALTEPPR